MEPRVSRRNLRIGLGIVAGLLVLAIGGMAVFLATFDPNSEKPRIIALVKQATGRDLILNGRIGLKLSLQPTLQVSGAALANPPGFSRPEMVTLQRLDLQLRLLPLLSRRVEIEQLVLVHPDILLETNPRGQPNWHFTPEPPATGQQAAPPEPATPHAPASSGKASASSALSVRDVRIEDGTIAWRDDSSGRTTTLAVQRLTAKAASPDAPLHVAADAGLGGTAFSLVADTGSLARLQDPAATTPWPVKLSVHAGAAKLDLDGSLTQPLQGRGYTVTVSGSVPDLAALAPLVPPGITLPPLHDVSFTTRLADRGGPFPEVSALTLHAGAADLSADYPGLMLDRLDVTAPALDQPAKLAVAVRVGATPLAADATLGAPGRLLPQAKPPAAYPVDATVQAAGATLSAKGQIARPAAMTGITLDVTGQIPDLQALSPLAGRNLPALKQISVAGQVADLGGGFSHGLALHDLRLTTPDGDLAGSATLDLAVRPNLVADLKSARLDLDGLQAAAVTAPAPPAAASANATQPAPAGKPGQEPPAGRPGQDFADRPIDWRALQLADANLTLSIGTLHAGGTDSRSVNAHLLLQGGRLSVDPFTADLPGGLMQARLSADATAKAPPVSLFLHEPGLPLAPLLAALHQPATASGNLEVYADLHGAGDTPHAITASLDGSLGIAMANGSVDNRLLGATLGKVLQAINAFDLVGRGGSSELRCLASRVDFRHGIGTVRDLALSSSLLTMTGGGSVNLAADSVDLLLKPETRIGGTTLVVPMRVSGRIGSPAVRIDSRGAAEDNAGTVAGAIIGNATPLGLLGGMLGADKLFGGGKGDVCAGPLALARGNTPRAEAARPEKGKPSGAAGVLQQLFR